MPDGLEGMDELEDALQRLGEAIAPGTNHDLLSEIGLEAVAAVREKFAAETAPQHVVNMGGAEAEAGNPWAPLAETTVRKKGHDIILIDTGALEDSVHHEVDGDRVLVGTDIAEGGTGPYPVFLQEGTAQMPARPFMGVDDEDLERIAEQAATYLEARFDG